MQRTALVLVLGAFAGGFVAGFAFRGGVSAPSAPVGTAPEALVVAPERVAAGDDTTEGVAPIDPAAGAELLRRMFGGGDRDRDRPRTRAEALDALRRALASGDEHATRRALDDLSESAGEPLAPEELDELAALLGEADHDLVRDLSRALVVAGGREGLARVMEFVDDPDQSIHLRRMALEGLSHVPRELAGVVSPVLADFLASGAPPDLEQSAAHAFGRLHEGREVDALLGLLGSHPETRPEVIFDTLGDFAKPGDSAKLLGLLGGEWSRSEERSLLRSLGRSAARAGEETILLDLLRAPPEGVSRELIAQALGDSAWELGTGVLRDALAATAGDGRLQEPLARALARAGGREGLELLVEAARDPAVGLDGEVLARALTEFQGRAAVPVMLELFGQTSDQEMLEPLARGLFRNATGETTDELLSIIEKGGDAWQRRAVAHALEEGNASNVSAERLLGLLRNESDQEVASQLARALGRLHPEALEQRGDALFEGAVSAVERAALADLVERFGGDGAAETLSRQLGREPDRRAQWEMARALGRLGDEGVARAGEVFAQASTEEHRHAILWGLEASRRPAPPGAQDLFLQAARGDPSPSIRGQAAEILARQGDPALLTDLQALLVAESHPQVQERIRRAIHDLETRR